MQEHEREAIWDEMTELWIKKLDLDPSSAEHEAISMQITALMLHQTGMPMKQAFKSAANIHRQAARESFLEAAGWLIGNEVRALHYTLTGRRSIFEPEPRSILFA